MNERHSIEQLVDEAIHSVIIGFDPEIPGSYCRCTETLLRLVNSVESATIDLTSRASLIARLKSHLAVMAFEVGEHSEAEKLAADVVELTLPGDPDYATAVLIRIKSLHLSGRHEEEIADALRYVDSEAFQGHALIHLLAKLARDHPLSIKWKESLVSRVKSYVAQSPDLMQHLEHAQFSTNEPEEYLIKVAAILRRLSLERTTRVLGETTEK